jgi:hypothetical protein
MKKRGIVGIIVLGVLLLTLLSSSVLAIDYLVTLQVSVEKSLYGPNEEMHVSGSLLLSNQSANDTGFLLESNATINFTIVNDSGIQAEHLLNTTNLSGNFRSRSDLYPSGIKITAPAGDGYYNYTAKYIDPNDAEWKSSGTLRVFEQTVDHVTISPDKAKYAASDNVTLTLRALREVGDRTVALANVTVNGSLTYTNRTIIQKVSCITGTDGICTTSLIAPTASATYILEANNFLSTSSFQVVPFEAFIYVKDSTGESFKEIFSANEVATIEVKVTFNGTIPTGEYVFNGTITDVDSNVITNISSTTLDSNNSFTNRFTFTISTDFDNGIYFPSVTVFKTGGGQVSTSTSFQARSWTFTVVKAAESSGFEYEYTAFPVKNVSFEVYPKERENGTVIQDLNSTQFNVTLTGKAGDIVKRGNVSWNATCSNSGCYTFEFETPSVPGRYVLATSLNHSTEKQTVHTIVSVTSTSLSAKPSNVEGDLKELFGTTEYVYIDMAAENTSGTVNITDVFIESIIYQNGTKFNYTEVSSWDDVNATNATREWAWNGSAQRIRLDAPKIGGNYQVNIFANNRTTATSTKFTTNPYSVCAVAKSTAGSVDSSTSFYVWQYKTTDTIYLELKITQAQNGVGRAEAKNSTFDSSNHGMGNACSIDTATTQAITNATLDLESVVNLQTGAKTTLNTTATFCSADDNSGTYTCTIKPETTWDGGRYIANVKITGSDGETVDRDESMFEAKAFYIWAFSNSWTNKPDSNLTFTIQMYEAGDNWWSNTGTTGGINGDLSIEKIEYNGKDGEWLWPPVDVGYNITNLNASNITNGRGELEITTARLPKGKWESGYYVMTIKGTNDATGESDYGQAWFGIKLWDAYSIPVEASGSSYRYKNSFSVKDNITLFIRLTEAGSFSDTGGTSLGGNVTVGVKKLQYYTSWPPTDLNKSAYSVIKINVNETSPWYGSADPADYSGYVMNITPTSGKWNGGYYNVILDVNGTETGYGWFRAVAFHVDTRPTNASGTYTYSNKGTGPVYFNVSTTKNRKNDYSYYSTGDYINTTLKDITLNTWLEDTWESVTYDYPEDLNASPLEVNGTVLLHVNKTGNWPSGYYWGEVTLLDSENSTGTGYMWFSVRPFRVETTVSPYTIDSDSNVSLTLEIKEPDWSNNNLIDGNYTVTEIFEDVWSPSGRTRTTYTDYYPNSSDSFNGTTILNITPTTTWGTANNGYHYLTAVVQDNGDNSTQRGWISFRSVPFDVSVGTFTNRDSVTSTDNATTPFTVTKSVSGANTTANVSRVFEETWPTQTEYNFSVGTCTSAVNTTACQVNGTDNVTFIPPSSGWAAGWHYVFVEFTNEDGSKRITTSPSVWFKSVQAYNGYFSNYDESGVYKYYHTFDENVSISIRVQDSAYVPQQVNITKVEMSEDGDSCWSEYCKTYVNHTYVVLNGSGGNEIKGNGTIKIVKPAANWTRGQHSIKATVEGPDGSAVIKTGYVWMKDTSPLSSTIVMPQLNDTINATSFLFNATTNKDAKCSLSAYNYDWFANWYCYDGVGNVSTQACNSTYAFNGSTNYYQGASQPPWGDMNTGGKIHHYNFSTAGWTNQDYGIIMWCNDADWNYVQAMVAFIVNVTPSPVAVTVNLSSPANASTVSNSSDPGNTSVTISHNITGARNEIINCTVYTNTSNTWAANLSNTVKHTNNTNTSSTNYINLTGFNDGNYIWNTYCYQVTNTTNNAWAAANFTFTIDSSVNNSVLNITLVSPADGSVENSSNVNFTYNFTQAANANCDIYANTSGNWAIINTSRNASSAGSSTNVSINNGNYIWNAYCVNTTDASKAGWGDSNLTFDVTSNSSITAIVINLSTPVNLSVQNSSPINFTYNATGPANMTCSMWSNSTGTWVENSTNSTSTPGQQESLNRNFVNGTYIWNGFCVDNTNSSTYGWASFNWSIIVTNITNKSTSMEVNLSAPANASIHNTSTITFRQNVTGSALQQANCSIYMNATAWEINGSNNFTMLDSGNTINNISIDNIKNGTYIWNAYCFETDDAGNNAWATLNYTFTVTNITNGTAAAKQIHVNLSNPTNGSTTSINPSFKYNITGPSSINCSVWSNTSGTWVENITNTSLSPGIINASSLDITSGTYIWNAKCVNATDSTSYAWGTSNWTFTKS